MDSQQAPVKKRRRLTFKQKRFVKEYVANNGNGTQAALIAYNTDNAKAASVVATENLANISIQQSIEEIANKQGITKDSILTNVNKIATREPEKVTAEAYLKANIELAKMLNMFPDKKSYQYSMSVKGNIKDLGYSEAKQQLDELNTSINSLQDEESIEADVA